MTYNGWYTTKPNQIIFFYWKFKNCVFNSLQFIHPVYLVFPFPNL